MSRKKPNAIGPGIDPITLAMQTCKRGKGQNPRLMTRPFATKLEKTTCNPIAKECSESRTDRRQATTMGIKRRKVTKTTKKLITMNGTRKLQSVAQFSLNAPDIRKKCEGGSVL